MQSATEMKLLSKDDYLTAAKKANAKTKDETFILVQLHNNSERLILPFKEGIDLINALQHAHTFRDQWSSAPTYKPLGEDLSVIGMSAQDVEAIKVAKLLGISVSEAKQLREEVT